MKECCENCVFAMRVADIDGLWDCELDGHSKDYDMVCEDFKMRKTLGWNDEMAVKRE